METTLTISGRRVPLHISGPELAPTVLLLPAANSEPGVFNLVAERLHTSDLRTIEVTSLHGVDASLVQDMLDELGIDWAHLVGDGEGADLAWELAATRFDRFSSLVVCDRGHPRVPDATGHTHLSTCPPVEVDTTILVSETTDRSIASKSVQYVYADFRVVDVPGSGSIPSVAAAQLATEIVLRSNPW